MPPVIREIDTSATPESVVEQILAERGTVLLRSRSLAGQEPGSARYSFVTSRPFLTFRSFGSRCEIRDRRGAAQVVFGNPWLVLEDLVARCEWLGDLDQPFPSGGCFGYWGYDLKNFVEPSLPRRRMNDLELPDCHVGFYDSLVAFDHWLGKTWVVSTGLGADGARDAKRAGEQFNFWMHRVNHAESLGDPAPRPLPVAGPEAFKSTFAKEAFIKAVVRAKQWIRSGDIYQVNLSQRLEAVGVGNGWNLFRKLSDVSPAPFSAFVDCGEFQIASSSPELFLRLSGQLVRTRPIKGTRPRSTEQTRDAQLAYELQTSGKEMAELVMITDLLRNDLGKVCEFGSIQVPELARLERYPHVHHLVSTVEGRLRPELTHLTALASCFPGGSITGAPKIRAMEIIDTLEPVSRGPYTGALGYIGFNRESQLSILIRAAICRDDSAFFSVGSGIVADSDPEAEYDETLAKAAGFLAALDQKPAAHLLQSADHRGDAETRKTGRTAGAKHPG